MITLSKCINYIDKFINFKGLENSSPLSMVVSRIKLAIKELEQIDYNSIRLIEDINSKTYKKDSRILPLKLKVRELEECIKSKKYYVHTKESILLNAEKKLSEARKKWLLNKQMVLLAKKDSGSQSLINDIDLDFNEEKMLINQEKDQLTDLLDKGNLRQLVEKDILNEISNNKNDISLLQLKLKKYNQDSRKKELDKVFLNTQEKTNKQVNILTLLIKELSTMLLDSNVDSESLFNSNLSIGSIEESLSIISDIDLIKGKEEVYLEKAQYKHDISHLKIGIVETPLNLTTRTLSFKLPYIFPFFFQCNLLITFDNPSKKLFKNTFKNLVTRVIGSVSPDTLKLHLIDLKDLGLCFEGYRKISKNICNVVTNEEDFSSLISDLKRIVIPTNGALIDHKNNSNIGIYNSNNKNNLASCHLIILVLSAESIKYINEVSFLLEKGPIRGVCTIVVLDKSILEFHPDLNFDHLKSVMGSYELIELDKLSNGSLKLETVSDTQIQNLVTHINLIDKIKQKVKIKFSDYMLPKDLWMTEQAHKSVEIPFGLDKLNNILSLKFLTEANMASGLIIGTPGSGKSNLLHVIITNLCIKYSPFEVELYLIDLNSGGAEFIRYADFNLPHAKKIVLGSTPEYAKSSLEEVQEEMERRGKLFTSSAGIANSLSKYNEQNQNNKLPRIIIIVDEFITLFQSNTISFNTYEIESLIENIVKKGRKYGINLLMATQNLSGGDVNRSILKSFHINVSLGQQEHYPKDIVIKSIGQGLYNENNSDDNKDNIFQTFFIEDSQDNNEQFSFHEILLKEIYDYSLKNKLFRTDKTKMFSDISIPEFPINTELVNADNLDQAPNVNLCIGESFDVTSRFFALEVNQDMTQNVLICGSGERNKDQPLNVISSIIKSLLIQSVLESPIEICIINKSQGPSRFDSDLRGLDTRYNQMHLVEDNPEEILEKIKNEIEERQKRSNYKKRIFLIIVKIDSNRSFISTPESQCTEYLTFILQNGPLENIHVVVQTEAIRAFILRLDSDQISNFNHRVGLQMDEESSEHFINSSKGALLKSSSALYDSFGLYYYHTLSQNTKIKIYPYQFPVSMPSEINNHEESDVNNKIAFYFDAMESEE